MAALLAVTGLLVALHVFEPATWYAWAAWLYVALCVNKALFCVRFGGAFPAVFGLSETGMFSVNPTWYLFSCAVLCVLAVAAVAEALYGGPYAFAVLAATACGRATIPALVTAHFYATSFDRQMGSDLGQ